MKLLKNRKAQVGIIGGVFLFLIFVVVWFAFLGGFVAKMGQQVVQENNIGGVEGFFISNLNLVIFIGLLLGIMYWIYRGGQ